MIWPVNPSTGLASFVPASASQPPYTYMGALKLDARGRVVTLG